MKTRDSRIEILTDLESKVKYSLETEPSGVFPREQPENLEQP